MFKVMALTNEALKHIRKAEDNTTYGKFMNMFSAAFVLNHRARKEFHNLSRDDREASYFVEGLTELLHAIYTLKSFFLRSASNERTQILERLRAFEEEIREALLESLLIKSPKHSKPFQMVVLRNGSGSSPNHYETVGGLQPANEVPSEVLQKVMPKSEIEEFLTDEDYDPATNLREVTVREVRFGRKRASASFQEVTTTQLVFDEE